MPAKFVRVPSPNLESLIGAYKLWGLDDYIPSAMQKHKKWAYKTTDGRWIIDQAHREVDEYGIKIGWIITDTTGEVHTSCGIPEHWHIVNQRTLSEAKALVTDWGGYDD